MYDKIIKLKCREYSQKFLRYIQTLFPKECCYCQKVLQSQSLCDLCFKQVFHTFKIDRATENKKFLSYFTSSFILLSKHPSYEQLLNKLRNKKRFDLAKGFSSLLVYTWSMLGWPLPDGIIFLPCLSNQSRSYDLFWRQVSLYFARLLNIECIDYLTFIRFLKRQSMVTRKLSNVLFFSDYDDKTTFKNYVSQLRLYPFVARFFLLAFYSKETSL